MGAPDPRFDWFPCEPGPLLGALSAMKPHVGYVYWIVCLRIYEVGGPIRDNFDAIARRTGYSKRVVTEALAELFKTEKLHQTVDGIMNPKAAAVLEEMRARRGKAAAAGRDGANRRWGKNKSDQSPPDSQPKPTPMPPDAQLQGTLDITPPNGGVPPAEDEGPRRKRAGHTGRRAMLPADWVPDDRDRLYAKSKGFTDPKINQMAEAFVNRHRSIGTLIADIPATWKTWVTNEIKFTREREARQPQKGRTAFQILSGETRDGH